MTNREWLTTLTDFQLAAHVGRRMCPPPFDIIDEHKISGTMVECPNAEIGCRRCWVRWLKGEHKE